MLIRVNCKAKKTKPDLPDSPGWQLATILYIYVKNLFFFPQQTVTDSPSTSTTTGVSLRCRTLVCIRGGQKLFPLCCLGRAWELGTVHIFTGHTHTHTHSHRQLTVTVNVNVTVASLSPSPYHFYC